MGKILLDYAFPISLISPTPQASTGFLKRVCVVAKPKAGQEGNVGNLYPCTSMVQVAERTDNTDAQQLFNAGMSHVFILLADDLDLAEAMEEHRGNFWTVLIASGVGGFDDSDVLEGVVTPAVPAVQAQVKVQDVLFRALEGGAADGVAGNDWTIIFEDALEKNDGSATVAVAGSVITVDIEDGVTTAETIETAFNGSSLVNELFEAIADDGDESDPQEAFSPAVSFAGGVDEVPEVPGGDGLDIGPFDGVVGFSTQDDAVASAFAAQENRTAFLTSSDNKGKSLFYAFGKLLSNLSNWSNQQYVPMPVGDGVDELGEANALFDDKVSFVLTDDEFSNRLALFATGGKAIIAPYVLKNLRIDLQSRALQWISANQPQYTLVEATRLENRLQEDVVNSYISRGWISGGTVAISLQQTNFVANGLIEVPEPTALWRVFSEMRTTV